MKINSKKKSQNKVKKTVFVIVAVVILLLIAATALAYIKKVGPFFPALTGIPTTPNSNNNNTNETPVIPPDSKPPSTGTTDKVPVDTASVASIDVLNQKAGFINFTATATNIAIGGTCSVVYSNPNAKPVTREFTATTNGTGISCVSPPISENEFSYLGNWTATFRYFLNSKQVTAEKTITIQ